MVNYEELWNKLKNLCLSTHKTQSTFEKSLFLAFYRFMEKLEKEAIDKK